MKPLQKDLEIELPSGEPLPIAKGPVGTGETRLHDSGCTTDHHERHEGDHEVSHEGDEPSLNRDR